MASGIGIESCIKSVFDRKYIINLPTGYWGTVRAGKENSIKILQSEIWFGRVLERRFHNIERYAELVDARLRILSP